MSKSFLLLSFLMGVVVLSSNYLVQFPINYYGLNEILTYGAFSYPIAFLITDLANRSYGKRVARKIVYFGFVLGIGFTVLFSTDFADLISIRIAIGSGIAFLTAQLLDVQIFDRLRKKEWFVAPLTSSMIGSTIDTFLFFSTNFSDLISIRIAIGSGVAFIIAQLLDVHIFDRLRNKKWFVAPITSSLIGSFFDTFLFFSISFYGTGVPWITLSLGDLAVKVFVALIMLIPFRLLLGTFKAA